MQGVNDLKSQVHGDLNSLVVLHKGDIEPVNIDAPLIVLHTFPIFTFLLERVMTMKGENLVDAPP